MKIKPGFVLRDVCGQQVIMGEGLGAIDFGRLLCLNETAAFLWKIAMEGEFTVESLSEKLLDVYDVAKEQALADVTQIVNEWKKVNVIE